MNLSEPLQPSGTMPAIAGQTLLPGTQLGGYEVLQALGFTSCGVLYLARHLKDGSAAAIKEYMPSTLAARMPGGHVDITDPAHVQAYQRGLQAFLAEAMTLAQFDHPNLLRVHTVWEANGTAYRSMPYLTGDSLLAWRSARSEPATPAQLHALFDGLLNGLLALYQSGIAHGRVEPLNVHLDDEGRPILMDFESVHQAVQSDLRKPHVDAYADPTRMQALVSADLQAVAALLHFAIGGQWIGPRDGQAQVYPPLADVLLRLKEQASVLQYRPEFLAAVDTALALPPTQRPGTVTEFRALFEPPPPALPLTPAPATRPPPAPASRRARHDTAASPAPAQPLNSSETVLALLANFERGPAPAAEDVEPFQPPELPTLTEEAEPALPPLRSNPFDDLEDKDARDTLPVLSADDPSDFEPLPYAPMPRIRRRSPWRERLVVIAGLAAVVLGAIGVLGWQLFR